MADELGWLWITEADVVSLMDLGDALEAVRSGFADEARGTAQNMVKTMASWDGATLHAIGATFAEAGYVGTKTWAHTPDGATPLLVLFRSDGSLAAIIEAFALGQLRTGAVSGVATDLLAAPDASELAIIGTGKQALTQVAAVDAVRPLHRIRVHGRDAGRRTEFAALVEATLGIETVSAPSVAAAVDGADIITLATRATEPFLEAGMVPSGVHVNAMGAIALGRQEFEPRLLDRCEVITADSVPQARERSREFIDYFGQQESDAWSRVRPLCAALNELQGRPPDADVTLSKAMGTGICDLAVGIACYRAMTLNELGQRHDQPRDLPLRLRTGGSSAAAGYV
jgi:ornithine cyclodeaminase